MRGLVLTLCILATGIVWPEPDGRTWLALVGFSEARSESDECLATAMHTVIVRITDPLNRWPKSIDRAVQQPGQYRGLDNWPTPRHPERIDAQAWRRSLDMADRIIDQTAPVPEECMTADSFNQSVGGSICKCGAHSFFVSN